MLSRVANSLYWMSRYIERAENIARIVDVNLQLMLDLRNLDESKLAHYWMPIVQSTGDEALFFETYAKADGPNVTDFLTFRLENPNSILSAIAQARENARMVRDQISIEMWEEINRLYLFLRSPQARRVWKSSPQEFFQEIKSSSLFLQGLTDSTIPHHEGWNFMQVGKYIERADKTTRILDVRHSSVTAKDQLPVSAQSETLEWAAVLRSCSAWDAFKQGNAAEVEPRRVVEFLILSEDFPRSVRFCISAFDCALRRISGVPGGRYSNPAEKIAGRLLAELQFSSVDDIFERGLHEYLDLLQQRFNSIGDALFATYIFQPFNNPAEEFQQQQQ
ncbi:MAG TPA: alpha-E domain-containing protein [Verrucomicrobiae bacterium]